MGRDDGSPRRRPSSRRKRGRGDVSATQFDEDVHACNAIVPSSPSAASPPSLSRVHDASSSPERDTKGRSVKGMKKARKNHNRWDASDPADDDFPNDSIVPLRPDWTLTASELKEAQQAMMRRREVYCGNLTKGVVTEGHLRELFTTLFAALPEYVAKYPDYGSPVASIRLAGNGMYAFVEMMNEELCHTALKFAGVELAGRAVQIGRPSGFGTRQNEWRDTSYEAPGLDISPLQLLGIVPPPVRKPAGETLTNAKRERELYFGNLAVELSVNSVLTEVLSPAIQKLMEYDAKLGPPIININMGPHNMTSTNIYCFIEFQSEALTVAVLRTFDGMELMGKKVRVGRPSVPKFVGGRPVDPPPSETNYFMPI